MKHWIYDELRRVSAALGGKDTSPELERTRSALAEATRRAEAAEAKVAALELRWSGLKWYLETKRDLTGVAPFVLGARFGNGASQAFGEALVEMQEAEKGNGWPSPDTASKGNGIG
jgi:hypothetical protein